MNTVNFEMDTREFNEALQLYSETTSKTAYDAVNGKAYDIALRSIKYTSQASKDEIKELINKPWWWKMVVKRLKSSGMKATTANKDRKSKQIIAAKVRSVTFIKSGWFPAARILAASVGRAFSRQKGKNPMGGAKPANYSTTNDMTAELYNTAGNTKSRSSGQALENQRPAMDKAMDEVFRDMISYLERQMEKQANKYSAR